MEGHSPEDAIMPRDMFLLQVSFISACVRKSFFELEEFIILREIMQLCSGMDENAVGTCAELVFAPIDASFADDAPLLPSGFRIISLESGKVCISIHLFVLFLLRLVQSICYPWCFVNMHSLCRKLPVQIVPLILLLLLRLAQQKTKWPMTFTVVVAHQDLS